MRAGREVFRKRVATPRGDYAATIAAVKALVQRDRGGHRRHRHSGRRVAATGLVKNANSTWLIGKPLAAGPGEGARAGRCRLENDANCFALSEAVDGAGKGAAVVFGVILGTGVGGGIVVDGKVIRGRERDRGGVGAQPAAGADRGRPAASGLLLRP